MLSFSFLYVVRENVRPRSLQELRNIINGRAVAQTVNRRLSTAAPGFKPGSGYVGFVVDKAAMEHVLSENLDFQCKLFHRLFHTHYRQSSGAGK
jgi:hypothetical protein